jgi:hypothetical protein
MFTIEPEFAKIKHLRKYHGLPGSSVLSEVKLSMGKTTSDSEEKCKCRHYNQPSNNKK